MASRNAKLLQDWLCTFIEEAEQDNRPLHDVLVEFRNVIERDTLMYMLFTAMFEEQPLRSPYRNKPRASTCLIRDYKHMLQVPNHVLITPPKFDKETHLIGVLPVFALLDWPMSTPSGYAAFLVDKVNEQVENVLNEWTKLLAAEESATCLPEEPGCWYSIEAEETVMANATCGMSGHPRKFEDVFVCDPSAPRRGYKSWDDYFVRCFRDGIRPVAAPDTESPSSQYPDPSAVVVNACESAPYRLSHSVAKRDRFWIKGQPYSMVDILTEDAFTDQFVSGTVFQTFLNPLSYHRWHAPVSGKIREAYVVPGTYYTEPFTEDMPIEAELDPGAPFLNQASLVQKSTRALFFIEADNERIGLMCVVMVGISEVSTCEITVEEGQHVMKGDEIGSFHYGGSTYCFIFGP